MKRTILALLAILGVLLMSAPPAQAAAVGGHPTNKWRNCEQYKSALVYRATFTLSPNFDNAGTYYLHMEIRWDLNKAGLWRNQDHHEVSSTRWAWNGNAIFDSYSTIGDQTTWGTLSYGHWRAHVIIKLKKVRSGPDKTVLTDNRYFSKTVFPERGDLSLCTGIGGL